MMLQQTTFLLVLYLMFLCAGHGISSKRYGDGEIGSLQSSSSSSSSSSSFKKTFNKLASYTKDSDKRQDDKKSFDLLAMTSKEDVNEKLKAPIFIGNSTGIKQQQQQQQPKIMDVPMSGDGDEDEEDGKLILVMKETTSTSYHDIKQDKKKHSFDGVFVHNVNKHPVVETISREESLKAIYLLDKGMFPLLHL